VGGAGGGVGRRRGPDPGPKASEAFMVSNSTTGTKVIRLSYYTKLNGKIKGFAHNILKKIIIL